MNDQRPNPEELLQQIKQQENTLNRGKLKIFFGSSAGVGKTYDMLSAAHRDQACGLDVLVGIVETHGRSETAALLDGLPILPLRHMEYREQVLTELNLDGALARRPDILLVDELAHSNIPGSRHPKRWHDVEELLKAGISVYTTVNVQHLESLNDVVNQITGVVVQETIPDWFFDQANEVVLVDLPADELLARLYDGKVYIPSQAKHAIENFFRKGNLIALRELALRRTADLVDADMRDYRKQSRISSIWNTADQLLVGISTQEHCERLIRHAARLASSLHSQWYVVYVETPRSPHRLSKNQQNVLAALRLADELGAKTEIISASTVAEGLVSYAHQFNIGRIIIGQNQSRFAYRRSLVKQILEQDVNLDLVLVNQAQKKKKRTSDRQLPTWEMTILSSKDNRMGYVIAMLGCTLVTVSLVALTRWFDLANVVMLYLLVIVFISVRFGRAPGIFAALLSVTSFDLFFVEPKLSFSVSDVQYLVTFAVMLVVSLIINNLAVGLRFQAQSARKREQQAISMSHLAQSLSAARKNEEIISQATVWLTKHIANHAVMMMPNAEGKLTVVSETSIPSEFDWNVTQWVFDHNESAGLATHTLPANTMHYRALATSNQVMAVLALLPTDIDSFNQPEQQRTLDVAIAQISLALERVYYAKVAQNALIKVESERLRGSLLSALSHDIRTPITVLSGLAASLATQTLQVEEQKQLAVDIEQQANVIQRLVINILDYVSLQSGGMKLNKQWVSLEEIIGSNIRQLEPYLQHRQINIEVPNEVDFIYTDELILSRILSNLLTNAINYTPDNTTIHIQAALNKQQSYQITVTDSGNGLPAGMEEQIFERFTRGDTESNTTGLGLGLALSRDLVEHLGGTLSASNVQPHGAQFVIVLPWTPLIKEDMFNDKFISTRRDKKETEVIGNLPPTADLP
ncbi:MULTISPECIES: DUF4118 domain-containing protein [Psychrobacter]|uniref:DUF4118 domain-containing protein n=1 Tax=Psychrobacter TaxID=497 RepID=UPI000EC6919F|nr:MULTISPECIES: DUF4118 domain-containing protein [Psychrobacter]HCN18537.1 two-component sensor histidine kinase [Psychrobacter sp.]